MFTGQIHMEKRTGKARVGTAEAKRPSLFLGAFICFKSLKSFHTLI